MSNPPSVPPPGHRTPPLAVGYQSVGEVSGARRNSPLKFLGRMMLGIALGVGGCVSGFYLAHASGVGWLFFLPLAAALATAIVIAVKFRRYGYVTGVIVAPFLIVASLMIILLIICGHALGTHTAV